MTKHACCLSLLLAALPMAAQEDPVPATSRVGVFAATNLPLGPWASDFKTGYGLGLHIRFNQDHPRHLLRLRMDYFANDSRGGLNPEPTIPGGRSVRFEGYSVAFEWTPAFSPSGRGLRGILGLGGTNLHRTDRYTSTLDGPQTATQPKVGMTVSAGLILPFNDHLAVEARVVHIEISELFSAGEFGRNRDRFEVGLAAHF